MSLTVLGGLGTALFTIARTPEMYEGWDRNRKREPPTQELTDGVFVFLMLVCALHSENLP